MSERDTHFAGFARLLLQEIDDAIGQGATRMQSGVIYSGEEFAQELGQIIARRAYDLVEHVLKQTPTGDIYIRWFKDMETWPEQGRFANALSDMAKTYQNLTRPKGEDS